MFALVITVAIVIGVSFMCSLLEAVLLSTRPAALEAAEKPKKKAAAKLMELRSNLERPISAILIANTIANTAGATVAGALALAILGDRWMACFSFFLTLGILFISEILPKTLGALHWRFFWPVLTPVLDLLVKILAPGVWLCQKFALLLGAGKPKKGPSESEVLGLVRLAAKMDAVSAFERSLIERVFQLDRVTARDIMTPRTVVAGLEDSNTVEESRKEAVGWGFSRLPVWSGDRENVVGYLYVPDLWSKEAEERLGEPVSAIMRPVAFLPETVRGDTLLERLLETRSHIAMVVDEYGGLSGLVTLEDVIEELVGREIVGETDLAVDMQELARRRGKLKV